jgi:uncharacterized integral membrane protein
VTSTDKSRVRIPGTKLEGWRAIAVGILALYVLLFVILNRRHVEVNFVFYKVRSTELLGLIVILLLGFAAGFIVGGRRQKARSSAATAAPEPEEGTPVGRGTGPPADASSSPLQPPT